MAYRYSLSVCDLGRGAEGKAELAKNPRVAGSRLGGDGSREPLPGMPGSGKGRSAH